MVTYDNQKKIEVVQHEGALEIQRMLGYASSELSELSTESRSHVNRQTGLLEHKHRETLRSMVSGQTCWRVVSQ